MKTFELKGEIRADLGKKAARAYRREGLIPCVVYGGQENENICFAVKNNDVRNLVYTPEVYLVNLDLGEKKLMCVVREVQFHPVKDTIIHMDFLRVFKDVPLTIALPVRLEGLAAGVKAGGRLALVMRKLKVKGMVADLPDELVVNVEKLEVGKSIQVGDISYENLEILNPKDVVICRVQSIRAMLAANLLEAEPAEEDVSKKLRRCNCRRRCFGRCRKY